jgi:hypothetical protein
MSLPTVPGVREAPTTAIDWGENIKLRSRAGRFTGFSATLVWVITHSSCGVVRSPIEVSHPGSGPRGHGEPSVRQVPRGLYVLPWP